MSNRHEPGTYVKGDQVRVAETPADAVAAVFDGFKLVAEPEAVEAPEPVEEPEVETPDEDERPAEVNGSEDPFDHFDA